MPQQIFFRVDAAPFMGSGHIRRCLTLANQLSKSGRRSTFICGKYENSFNHLVTADGHDLVEISPVVFHGHQHEYVLDASIIQGDALETMKALKLSTDGSALDLAIVVDHYGLNHLWHRHLRPLVQTICVIDDLGNKELDCDILVCSAPQGNDAYRDLSPENCQRLLGAKFAILRPEFRKARARDVNNFDSIKRIIVSLGAMDPDNISSIAIGSIRQSLGKDVVIDVVLGEKAKHLEEVQRIAACDPHISCFVEVTNMARLMARADLAIGAGGTTSWERACLGLPTLVVIQAENQRMTADLLTKAGASLSFENNALLGDKLSGAMALLRENPGLMKGMSQAAMALTDGLGTNRVAAAIIAPDISVRLANISDARLVWEWRNDETVRKASTHAEPIEWAAHEKWYRQKLTNATGALLIACEYGEPVGVVRYDALDADASAAVVSIYLGPQNKGRGIGPIVLQKAEEWLGQHRADITTLYADVNADNEASLALFSGAAYRPHSIRHIRKT